MEETTLLEKGLKFVYAAAMLCFVFAAFNMIFRTEFFNFKFGDNILEKATILGSSTRNDFDEFQREGGLETENIWNEFYVESVETSYNENDILRSVTFRLDKKGYANLYGSIDANYSNIVDNLGSLCGSNWAKQNEIENVYEASNEGYYCKYEYPSSSSSVFLTISTEDDPRRSASSSTSGTPRSAQFQASPAPVQSDGYRAATSDDVQSAARAAAAAEAAAGAAAEVSAAAEGF